MTKLTQIIPGMFCVHGSLGTVAGLGTVRKMPNGFSFFPQPVGSNAERELAHAGYHGRRLDGYSTAQEAANAAAAL